jgi:hypothetical protein
MKKTFVAITILLFTSVACSFSGLPLPTRTESSEPAAVPAQSIPGSPVDPRALDTAGLEECSILPESDLSALLSEAPIDRLPNSSIGITGCNYRFNNDKFLSLEVTVDRPGRQAYDGMMQYLEASQGTEPLALGEIAVIKEVDGMVYLDAVFNGWYVSLRGNGFRREAYLTIAQWLTSRFVPFTSVAGAEPTAAPTTSALSGQLVEMKVVIESPPELAGTTTLEDLKASDFMYFATCSTLNRQAIAFVVNFQAVPSAKMPTPVVSFLISAENGVVAGQPTPAEISIGVGPSDPPQTSTWNGTILVAADGTSGTFEAAGQVKGSWSCAFAP